MSDSTSAVIRYRDGSTEKTEEVVTIDSDDQNILIGDDRRMVSSEKLKAVFFLGHRSEELDFPGGGTLLTVSFEDGEELRGVAPEYNPSRRGFLLYPTEGDRVSSIFVVTSAVESIEVERF